MVLDCGEEREPAAVQKQDTSASIAGRDVGWGEGERKGKESQLGQLFGRTRLLHFRCPGRTDQNRTHTQSPRVARRGALSRAPLPSGSRFFFLSFPPPPFFFLLRRSPRSRKNEPRAREENCGDYRHPPTSSRRMNNDRKSIHAQKLRSPVLLSARPFPTSSKQMTKTYVIPPAFFAAGSTAISRHQYDSRPQADLRAKLEPR